MFASALTEKMRAGKTAALPRLLLELTSKNIFVTLLEAMPDAVYSSLVSLYSSLYCDVLRRSRGDARTVANFQ